MTEYAIFVLIVSAFFAGLFAGQALTYQSHEELVHEVEARITHALTRDVLHTE